jgi:hypothetical protein
MSTLDDSYEKALQATRRERAGVDANISRAMTRAMKSAAAADKLAEKAAIDTFEAFRIMKFGKTPLSPKGQKAMERADKAHDHLGNARAALGDAVYQLEQAVKD